MTEQLSTPNGETIEIVDHPDESRFQVRVGGREAGSAYYRLEPGRVAVTHTEIDPEFEGQGVGSAMARTVLDEIRDRQQTVVPLCPFIAGYIKRHPEYTDLVEPTFQRLVASADS
jgi:predicted GNAT family acetyltransferase